MIGTVVTVATSMLESSTPTASPLTSRSPNGLPEKRRKMRENLRVRRYSSRERGRAKTERDWVLRKWKYRVGRRRANVKCFTKILNVKYFTQICLGWFGWLKIFYCKANMVKWENILHRNKQSVSVLRCLVLWRLTQNDLFIITLLIAYYHAFKSS